MIGTQFGTSLQVSAVDPRLIVLPLLLGLGLYLLLTAQPIGRPRPDLGERLRRMDVDERIRIDELERVTRQPLFSSRVLENMLRPVVEDAGRVLRSVLVGWAWQMDASWRSAFASSGRASKWCSSWAKKSPPV